MHAIQTVQTSLELGGKNPCIVFADCDIESAVEGRRCQWWWRVGTVETMPVVVEGRRFQ